MKREVLPLYQMQLLDRSGGSCPGEQKGENDQTNGAAAVHQPGPEASFISVHQFLPQEAFPRVRSGDDAPPVQARGALTLKTESVALLRNLSSEYHLDSPGCAQVPSGQHDPRVSAGGGDFILIKLVAQSEANLPLVLCM